MGRPKSSSPRDSFANVRLTSQEREEIEATARALGLRSISEYLRHLHKLHNQPEGQVETSTADETQRPSYNGDRLKSFFKTQQGQMYQGNSLDFLHSKAKEQSVDLIMTSPPFGLVRKKSYGNEDADEYCNWFRPFAEGFKRVLKNTGSLVIDIGGAWKPGMPTRSLYHFELLMMLCREYGFHLCQEHFWWNPSKLPTPAEWVNVRRVRVKDAVNCIWWLSPTPWPKANNRRILAPYSESMRHLLKNGYTAKMRPSGHDISDKFQRDNGGAVPPNLLAVANTESNGRYQDFCRLNNLEIHPARFPSQLPEYFIRMLTDPGDIVVDPFGGSCVTGMVADDLKRRWVCIEMSESYLQGAVGRFKGAAPSTCANKRVQYTINPPCSLPVDDAATPLPPDGGQSRPPIVKQPKGTERVKVSKLSSRRVTTDPVLATESN
ncbi:MAG: site-specific DNA-methyltransferase [Betaproteobacteria bacterium]|nr:site-specific DNA-methyltransferase [Betaproteobacteria bacterium]